MFGNFSLFNIFSKENDIFLLHVILGILNSKILTWYGLKKGIILVKPGKTPQIRSGQRGTIGLRQLPIPNLYSVEKQNIAQEIEKLVDQILTIKNQDKVADTKNLECQIDVLVYELYELNEEEIKVIENS